MCTIKLIKSFVIISLLSVLAACGGGGGSDDSAVVPGDIVSFDMAPPKIVSRSPDGADVDVSTWGAVSLTFDEEIDLSSVSENTIQLINLGMQQLETGTISNNSTFTKITFETANYLMAYAEYQVDFTGIADVYGNLLEQPQSWKFTTGFDQSPPVEDPTGI